MHSTHRDRKASRRGIGPVTRIGLIVVTAVVGAVLGASGCLDRPLCDADCQPRTTNVFVSTVTNQAVDKIDLLFMIDNSSSMADKQAVLQAAVPDLVKRLVQPNCIDSSGASHPNPGGQCPDGQVNEFNPIGNIHIGVITSSLGDHGASVVNASNGVCPRNDTNVNGGIKNESQDDRGWLLGARPRGNNLGGGPEVDPKGFLNWNPTQNPQVSLDTFNSTFKTLVSDSGEYGCGFEAQLEAIYRFLADPQPPAQIITQPCGGQQCAVPSGLDQSLLAQRAAFLRADSLVAIIMLTDENDCSVKDSGQNYIVTMGAPLPFNGASSACATNPNDPCCYACNVDKPSSCPDDPACQNVSPEVSKTFLNLRCMQQKRRFGFDFLYPTQRYVNMLTQPLICPSNDDLSTTNCKDANPSDNVPAVVPNPLFSDLQGTGLPPRNKKLVYLAGIVGVPWQDIQATSDANGNPYPANELHYKVASAMAADGTWDVILGDPEPPPPPANAAPRYATDPNMLEERAPRTGVPGPNSPVFDATIANGYVSKDGSSPKNGHDWNNTAQIDLQYACIFPLQQARDCANLPPGPGGLARPCDCGGATTSIKTTDQNPLCQDPATGQYGTTQFFAKAYPGLRELKVLHDFGDNSIVASICARNLSDDSLQDYGYRPAVQAIIDRLKEALTGKCLPRKLELDPQTHKIPCSVIEASTDPKEQSCSAPGRQAPPSTILDPVRTRLKSDGICDDDPSTKTIPDCNSFYFCQINEAGPDCVTGGNSSVGWCYVDPSLATDPAQQQAENDLVKNCPVTQKRILRFEDPNNATPAKNATVLIACLGAEITDNSSGAPTGGGTGGSATTTTDGGP